jgi:hypothetical protein
MRLLPIHPALAALFLTFAACAAGERTVGVCTPGQEAVCFCENGAQGTLECREDGTGFDPCRCGRVIPDGGASDVVPADDDASDECSAPPCGPSPDDARDDAFDTPTPDAAPETGPADVRDTVSVPDADTASPDADTASPDIGPVAPRSLPNGADCEASAECVSGICLGLAVAGTEHSVCAEPCCHEAECDFGFGCLRLGAGRFCLPSRIYPSGYTFTAPTGGSCGPGGNACQSGICDAGNDLCRGTCCTDRDCGVAPCSWSITGSSQSLYCDPLALLNGFGRTGDPCFAETDCQHGICVPSPAGGFVCADPCCSAFECTGTTTCGLVQGLGSALARACVPQPPGALADGEACSDGGESCRGGHCIDGACRSSCCLDGDCVAPLMCRPARTPDGVVSMFCLAPP